MFYNRKNTLSKIAKQNVNFHRFSEKTKCELNNKKSKNSLRLDLREFLLLKRNMY